MRNIRMDRDGAVGIITIDRTMRMNSFDVETAQDFRKAGLEYARDESVRAVVLRGAGGMFCSGADLKYIRSGGDGGLDYLRPKAHHGFGAGFKQILEYLHSTISEIKRSPKPWIAAVDGIAAAGGFGIAMACDLVFASERAGFEFAYPKTGLTGAESSTFFLPRLVGLRRALELLYLNPRLDAKQAREYGLVSAVFPTPSFDDEVARIARRLAEGPTHALGIAKNLIHLAASADRLDWHLDEELNQLTRIADGPDFAEGLQAFFDKRAPRFGEGLMHEYSLVATLVERVEEEARKAGACAVERILVQIGDRAGVERELFATAFDTFKNGICGSAALEIVPSAGEEIILERVEMEVP